MYYRTLSAEDHEIANQGMFNFDTPAALDLTNLADDLHLMKEGGWPVVLPQYDFVTHARRNTTTALNFNSVVIVEGLFVLAEPRIREVLDLRLFAQNHVDTCLAQRLRRDAKERGIPMEKGVTQYLKFVKPSLDLIIKPSAAHADMVVPVSKERLAAVNV